MKEHVAASTQNQALSSLLFLYEHVLERPLDRIRVVVCADRTRRLPVVLMIEEVQRVVMHLSGDKWLIATLLYGGGLRLLEALRLRVKDLEFEGGEITVRQGKGDKDRVTILPQAVIPPLQNVSAPRSCARPTGLGRRLRSRRTSLRPSQEIPQSGSRVGLAVRVSAGPSLARPNDRRPRPPSSRRIHHAKGGNCRRTQVGTD